MKKKTSKTTLLIQFENEYRNAYLFEVALELTQEKGDQSNEQLAKFLKISFSKAAELNELIDGLDGDQMDSIVEKYDTSNVIDKYMNMKTDLFDSDDLNKIIDRIEFTD